VISLLIDAGADVGWQTLAGLTPWMIARGSKQLEICDMLVKAGAPHAPQASIWLTGKLPLRALSTRVVDRSKPWNHASLERAEEYAEKLLGEYEFFDLKDEMNPLQYQWFQKNMYGKLVDVKAGTLGSGATLTKQGVCLGTHIEFVQGGGLRCGEWCTLGDRNLVPMLTGPTPRYTHHIGVGYTAVLEFKTLPTKQWWQLSVQSFGKYVKSEDTQKIDVETMLMRGLLRQKKGLSNMLHIRHVDRWALQVPNNERWEGRMVPSGRQVAYVWVKAPKLKVRRSLRAKNAPIREETSEEELETETQDDDWLDAKYIPTEEADDGTVVADMDDQDITDDEYMELAARYFYGSEGQKQEL
jgi:hypothetical protein